MKDLLKWIKKNTITLNSQEIIPKDGFIKDIKDYKEHVKRKLVHDMLEIIYKDELVEFTEEYNNYCLKISAKLIITNHLITK